MGWRFLFLILEFIMSIVQTYIGKKYYLGYYDLRSSRQLYLLDLGIVHILYKHIIWLALHVTPILYIHSFGHVINTLLNFNYIDNQMALML